MAEPQSWDELVSKSEPASPSSWDDLVAESKKDPGYVGEAVRGVKAGLKVQLPKMAGQALQFFGAEDTGRKLVEDAEARNTPALQESAVGQAHDSPWSVRGNVYEAATNAVPSLAPGAAGAAAGAALGSIIPGAGTAMGALVGYAVGSIAALPMFYGSQAKESYDAVKKTQLEEGKSEAEADSIATKTAHAEGAIEAGGEVLADVIPFAKLFKPVARPVAKAAGTLVMDALVPTFKQGAKTAAGIVGAEVATEMAQQAGEDYVRKEMGDTGPGATWGETSKVIMPTAIMSAIPGMAGAGARHIQRKAAVSALTDPETDPETRSKIAMGVSAAIQETDPTLARNFAAYAARQIHNDEPIEIGKDTLYADQQKLLPAPQPIAPAAPADNAADVAAAEANAAKVYADRNAHEARQALLSNIAQAQEAAEKTGEVLQAHTLDDAIEMAKDAISSISVPEQVANDIRLAHNGRTMLERMEKQADEDAAYAEREAQSIDRDAELAQLNEGDRARTQRSILADMVAKGQGDGPIAMALKKALGVKESTNASTVRSDQGQPAQVGQVEAGSGADSLGDVQQAPAAGVDANGAQLREAGGADRAQAQVSAKIPTTPEEVQAATSEHLEAARNLTRSAETKALIEAEIARRANPVEKTHADLQQATVPISSTNVLTTGTPQPGTIAPEKGTVSPQNTGLEGNAQEAPVAAQPEPVTATAAQPAATAVEAPAQPERLFGRPITEASPMELKAALKHRLERVRVAAQQELDRRTVKVPPELAGTVREMAKQRWFEEGGKAAGGQYVPGITRKTQAEMNEAGTGRTNWVGKPIYAGSGMSQTEVQAAVERAIAGQPMGERQRRVVQGLVDEAANLAITQEQEAEAQRLSDEAARLLRAEEYNTLSREEQDAEFDSLFGKGTPQATNPGAAAEGARASAGTDAAEARQEEVNGQGSSVPAQADGRLGADRGVQERADTAAGFRSDDRADDFHRAAVGSEVRGSARPDELGADGDGVADGQRADATRSNEEAAAQARPALALEAPTEVEVASSVASKDDARAELGALLDASDKAAAAAALGDAQWSDQTADKFLERYAEWLQQGAKNLGDALSRLFEKVLAAARTGVLSIAVAFNFSAADIAKSLPVKPTRTQIQLSIERPKADFKGVEASTDTRFVADWTVRNKRNEGAPFIIADKSGGYLYAFDGNGALIAKAPAIYGESKGDVITPEMAKKTVNEMTKADKVTPAGEFKAQRTTDVEYGQVIKLADYTGGPILIHQVYVGTPSEHRVERLASQNPEDKRISYGCINALPEFVDGVLKPYFQGKHLVTVLPDRGSAQSFFGIDDSAYDTKIVENVIGGQQANNVSWGSEKYGREERVMQRSVGARRRGSKQNDNNQGEFKLEGQTEQDLKTKEQQASTGKVEERHAAVRDRNEAILSAPEGTAPPRDVSENPVPTQQKALFSRKPAYTTTTDGKPLLGFRDLRLSGPRAMPKQFADELGTPYNYEVMHGAKHVGSVALIWKGGKVTGLLNIDTIEEERNQGIAENVVSGIIEHNGDLPLRAINILKSARGFWEKMGAQFVVQGDVEHGFISRDSYEGAKAARLLAQGGARTPEADEGPTSFAKSAGGHGADRRGGESTAEVGARAYRRAAGRYQALKAEDVRRIIAPIIKNWGNAPKIRVIATLTEAPEAVRRTDEAQREGGATGEPEAFIHAGTVYMVADGLASEASVVRALFHESFGHFGLRGVLGDRIVTVLNEVVKSAPKRVEAKAKEYGLDFSNQDAKLIAAEEVLAEIAQTRPTLGIVRRAVAVVRQFLRELGIDLKLSDSDIIANYILPAREFVTNAKQGGWTGGTAFARGDDAMFSRTEHLGTLTADQEAALRNVHGDPETWRTRLDALKKDWKKNLVQGIFDQYAPILDLSPQAYRLARMSKGGDSTLESLLMYDKVYVDKNGSYRSEYTKAKGFNGFAKVLASLHGEQDRFFEWVAALRAERLKSIGLENLYSASDIATLKTLNQGAMKDGTTRGVAYAKALKELNDWNDSVLKIAMDSGLIDEATRKMYEGVPYVPFYRLQEEGASFGMKAGLVNQSAWKKLKGGTAHLNDDLLANVLQNWSHLITASAKNRAAKATLEAAVRANVAEEVPSGTPGKGLVGFKENGKERVFRVTDPHLMDAISAMDYAGAGPWAKPFSAMKRALTIGVTVNPAFKIRNLIRDSIQAIGTAELSYNPAKNIAQGYKAFEKESEVRAQLLAAGGAIRFGSMLDGNNADRTRRLIEQGVKPEYILDDAGKVTRFWKERVVPAFEAYQEFGDRGEQISRAALYEQLVAKGMSHEEASFWARDLMDFSLMGKWTAVRTLAQVVPFWNARLQGIYKLGRATKADYKRMGTTLGAVALSSIALLLAYGDDDDWKKREEWDRENFWWFKVGGIAFRIPKPFEIGAMGTLAERSVEYLISNEMTGKRFAERMSATVFNQLSMNPTPQLVKPLMDLYANKDSFTDRPIETMGMEKLRKQDRATERTTELAKFLGSVGMPDPTKLVMGRWDTLSPVQIEALVRGYFGWLGTSTTVALDWGIRPMMDRGQRPDMQLRDVFLAGNFAETLPSNASRYVTRLYDQAQEIEQAYGSYRDALKRGDLERAKSIRESEADKLRQYGMVETIKRRESLLNEQARRIEASKDIPGDEKRRRLDLIAQRKNDLARALR